MSKTTHQTRNGGRHALALCAAIDLADSSPGEIEWLHLLPAGEIRTVDGRGPYRVEDVQALMAESMKAGKLVLDENHSTDLAAPKGGEAPARGWIVELQSRADGIWGRVELTPKGRQLLADKEYRGISPVIAHTRDKVVKAIARASLVNKPNLEGLTALHQEDHDMSLKEMLIKALGLDDDASDEAIVAAAKKGKDGGDAVAEAAQAAIAPIAKAAGLAEDAGAEKVIETVTALQAAKGADGNADKTIEALQTELTDVAGKLQSLQQQTARDKAEAFVDGAIAEGRVGVKPMREEYISMHMEDPARAEKLIAAMPALGTSRHQQERKDPPRSAELDEGDRTVIALMGIDPAKFKETRAAELGIEEEAA